MYRKRLILNLKLQSYFKKAPKESELFLNKKKLYEKRLDEINDFKMVLLEAMIENKNTEEEIKQWTENHRAAVGIYYALIEEIENRIATLKREKES